MFDPELVGEYIDSIADEILQIGDLIQFIGPTNPQELVQFVVREADLREGHRVLDAGCGTGYFDLLLLQQVGHLKVDGIDISHKLIERGHQLIQMAGVGPDRLSLIKGDFNKLSSIFQPNTFDRILFLESITHTPNYDITLKEAKKVLKPDGKIYIKTSFPIYYPEHTEQYEILKQYKDISLESNFVNFIFYHEFTRLLEANHFLCERTNFINPYEPSDFGIKVSDASLNKIDPSFTKKLMKLMLTVNFSRIGENEVQEFNYINHNISFLALNATSNNLKYEDVEFIQ